MLWRAAATRFDAVDRSSYGVEGSDGGSEDGHALISGKDGDGEIE